MRLVLRRMAREFGHRAEVLESPVDLVGMFSHNPPALVVLDIERDDEMRGERLGPLVRRCGQVPILIFSSLPEKYLKEVARKLGGAEVAHKGGGEQALRSAFARVLGTD
jgi:hypothetical protein